MTGDEGRLANLEGQEKKCNKSDGGTTSKKKLFLKKLVTYERQRSLKKKGHQG